MSRSNYPTDQKLISVYQNGTFFNPASSHYVSTGSSNVVCDRCRKSELVSCIGYGELDICLSCASDIESSVRRSVDVTPRFATNMMTSNLRVVKPASPRASLTRMATSDFKLHQTKMRSSDFRPKE